MNVLEHFVGAQADFAGPSKAVDSLAAEATNQCSVETLDLLGAGPLARIVYLFLLRSWVARARRRLRRLGATAIGSYGFYPDLHAPTFVFDLDGPARHYVECNMLPGGGRLRSLTARVVTFWAGCDPRVGAVVVVGTKR
jgi:hypothetical protein